MGLQIWLPLNGNLHNQGLKKIEVINNNTTFNSSGKIGQCCNIASGQYLGIDAENVNNNKYPYISIACWIYPTQSDSTERHVVCCYENGGCGINLKNTKFGGQIYVGGYKSCYTLDTISLNTWYHVCITYNGTKLRLYLNGEEVASVTASGPITYHNTCPWQIAGNPGATSFGSNNFIGKINDLRIYDYALSEKEVEEISKGLLLHYKLDSIINDNIYDCSGYGNNGIVYGTGFALSDDTIKYSNSILLPNDNWIRVLHRPTIVCPHDAITVSIWANIPSTWTYNRGCIISCQESGGWAIGRTQDNKLYFTIYADGSYRPAYADTSYTSGIYGGWHMFTGTADKSYTRFFLDGELVAEAENTATTDFSYYNNYIFIGAEARANTTTPYATINGLFSDARIYATALTKKQIKELYNTSATIDKEGNIYARELVE